MFYLSYLDPKDQATSHSFEVSALNLLPGIMWKLIPDFFSKIVGVCLLSHLQR